MRDVALNGFSESHSERASKPNMKFDKTITFNAYVVRLGSSNAKRKLPTSNYHLIQTSDKQTRANQSPKPTARARSPKPATQSPELKQQSQRAANQSQPKPRAHSPKLTTQSPEITAQSPEPKSRARARQQTRAGQQTIASQILARNLWEAFRRRCFYIKSAPCGGILGGSSLEAFRRGRF